MYQRVPLNQMSSGQGIGYGGNVRLKQEGGQGAMLKRTKGKAWGIRRYKRQPSQIRGGDSEKTRRGDRRESNNGVVLRDLINTMGQAFKSKQKKPPSERGPKPKQSLFRVRRVFGRTKISQVSLGGEKMRTPPGCQGKAKS